MLMFLLYSKLYYMKPECTDNQNLFCNISHNSNTPSTYVTYIIHIFISTSLLLESDNWLVQMFVCVEGDRQSVLHKTKVRTALKGDSSWIQRCNQSGPEEEEEEEEKPW